MFNPYTYKEAKSRLYIARRNKKLIPNKNTKFLIWSIPAKKTCINACAACLYWCYADKSEKAYPDVLPSRERNYKASLQDDFVDLMTSYIVNACKHHTYRNAKRIVFRIHESGDFYSQDYFDKWVTIANNCKGIKNLVFMAYTKSIYFVAGAEIPSNMVVRFSLWNDTPDRAGNTLQGNADLLPLAEKMGMPIYTAVPEFTNEPQKNRCLCVDCGTCNKCWSKIEKILCEIH